MKLVISTLMISLSTAAMAETQTYKTCTTMALQPLPGGFAQNTVGPFSVLVQFDEKSYSVRIAGEYGAKKTKPIDEVVDAVRSNAVDTRGRQIFNLTGRADTTAGTLGLVIALTDTKGSGYIRLNNNSKSAWDGKLSCDLE